MSRQPPSPAPTYLYKVIQNTVSDLTEHMPWKLGLTDADLNSGYIHLCTSRHIPQVLVKLFPKSQTVYVLQVPYQTVKHLVQWEDPSSSEKKIAEGKEAMPHYYHPQKKLGRDEVGEVREFVNVDGSWSKALEDNAGWLVY